VTTAIPVPVAIALPVPAGSPPTSRTSTRWCVRSSASELFRAARNHPARWLLAAIGAVTVISSAATVASPYLVERAPLLLMCLSPRVAFLGIAAGGTPLLTFLVLGTARLALTDPLHYLVGRRLDATLHEAPTPQRAGTRARARLSRLTARVPRPLRVAARPACYFAVLVRPNGANLLWAGTQRLPVRRIALIDLIGTVTYLLAVHTGAGMLTG